MIIEIDPKLQSIEHNPFKTGYEIEKIVAMNESQRMMWLSCKIGGDGASLAYNESISLDLKGILNIAFFQYAIKEVILRHEALRSVVSADGESIIVYKNIPFEVAYHDFSAFTDQYLKIKAFIAKEMQYVFDLQEGPLISAFIHQLSETHYYFTLIGHHMFCDGWSFGIILENIAEIYNAKVNGLNISLKSANQISEYAIDTAAFKHSSAYENVKAYWLNLYQDGLPVLDFPTDYVRPLNRSFSSNRFDHQISVELVDQVKRLGANCGASLINTLLSAFETFIFLKTNQTDFVIGLPTAGQAATEQFELVGNCVNLLALRTKIDLQWSFIDYLIKRKKDFFDAYENQKFTLGELIDNLDHKKDYSKTSLLPIIFNVDIGLDTSVSFDNLAFEVISNPRSLETFEIFLNATGSKSAFVLEWSYSTQLFKLETIKQLSNKFEQLLEILIEKPSITFQTLADRNASYWHNQLINWNKTEVDYAKEKSLCFFIDAGKEKYGLNTAVSCCHERLSYEELYNRACYVANHLIQKGITVGDVIAIDIAPSPALAVAILGILKSGAAFMLLNAEFPELRNAFILKDSETKLILTTKDSHFYGFDNLKVLVEDIMNLGETVAHEIIFPELNGENIAYVQYESHISGKPVAIKIKHLSLVNAVLSLEINPGIVENERLLSLITGVSETPIIELFVSINAGAQIVLADLKDTSDYQNIINLLTNERIDILCGNSSHWKQLIYNKWEGKSNLRIWHSFDQLTLELADQLLNKVSRLWSFYGHVETTFVAAIREIIKEDNGINLGWPIHNTEIFIYDEYGEHTVQGKTGEIVVGGDAIAINVLRPESSFLAFQGEGKSDRILYRTGDLGRFSTNGDLQFIGRLDQQIKIAGVRIQPAEIAHVLARQNNISEVLIIPKEDKQGNSYLVAYVTLKEFNNDDEKLIYFWKQEMRMDLPLVMIPEFFVILEKFPLTDDHKIDLNVLPKPKTEHSDAADINQFQQENEMWLIEIWKGILRLDEIGRNDDFFELGGTSMLAVKMISEIEKKIGAKLPLSILLKNTTIAQLAKSILSSDQVHLGSLIPIKTEGSKTPLYLIHGAGLNVLLFKSFIQHLDKEQPIYGIQAFGINGDQDIPHTIEEIAKKHLEEVFEIDPIGPYAIAGYSLGGYIAFEMARQVKELGKELCFLGIIDTYAYNKFRFANEPYRYLKKIKRQFHKFPYFVRSFTRQPKNALMYQIHLIQNRLLRLFSEDKVIIQTTASEEISEIYKIYSEAYEKYELAKQDIKIHLFHVKERLYYLDDRKYLGWKDLSSKDIAVYEVPGDHQTFLQPPNDANFAHALQAALDEVSC